MDGGPEMAADGGVHVGADAGTEGGRPDAGSAGAIDGGAPDAASPEAPISIAATQGNLSEGFEVEISGQGQGGSVGAVTVSGNVGTLEISGATYPVAVYEQIPYSAAGDTLYQMLGAAPDKLIVAWAYCSAGALTYVYYETTEGVPVTYDSATGTCTATSGAHSATVEFPSVTLKGLPLVQGFTMTDSQLSYDGSDAGVMDLANEPYSIYPFDTVDCSSDCGSPGWYELHSVLWNAAAAQACFGIYYLFVETPPADIRLDYVLCLPGLNDPAPGGVLFPGSYSYPDAGQSGAPGAS